MKIYSQFTQFCAVLSLVLYAACVTSSNNSPPRNDALPTQEIVQQTRLEGISKEQAVAIANEAATKSDQTEESFKVTACQRARLWVIIYDGGGPEYYIDKFSGAILLVQKVPQSFKPNAASGVSTGDKVISEAEAVEIAKKHFVDFLEAQGDTKNHVNDYDAVACELANAWRVFFEYRAAPGKSPSTLPNSNPPNYVVDKKSGEILFTTHPIAK